MSDLIHIISWERFCEKDNLNDLDKYAQFPMRRYPGLLDIRNLNTKQIGPPLQELPDNCLSILIEKSTLLLKHRQDLDSISGVDIIFKLLCLIARNNKNVDKLKDYGAVDIVLKYMDLTMQQLAREIDTEWLNLSEYLLYFLEIIYDPTFSWRRRKKLYYNDLPSKEQYNESLDVMQVTNEITIWICCQLNAFSKERDLRNRLLHLLCSILSGSKMNAQLLISPAIVDTFTFKCDVNADIIASFCFMISRLSEICPSERQEDLSVIVMKVLSFMKEKTEFRIHELRCISQLLDVNTELCEELLKCDIFSVFYNCLASDQIDKDICRQCFGILAKLTAGPFQAREQFLLSNGYDKMLEILTDNASQSAFMLDLVFSWAVCNDFDASKVSVKQYVIRDGNVAGLLVKWSTNLALVCEESASEATKMVNAKDTPQSIVNWKAIVKLMIEICHKSRPSTSKCCHSGIISIICQCIKLACKRIVESVPEVMDYDDKVLCMNVANVKRKCEDLLNGLFHLLEMFSAYSLSGNDLVSIIRLFKDKHSKSRGRRIIKMLNNIVSEIHHHHDVSCWFEFYQSEHCISISPVKENIESPLKPNLGNFQLDRETISHKILDTMAWKISGYSFTFHCWLNLTPVSVSEKVDSGHERSCIFRLLTANHNGFEAFLNMDGQLLVATCHQGEFHYVQVTSKNFNKKSPFIEEKLLKYDKWHMVDLVFQNARNFFGRSTLSVYIDGSLINTLDLKYPQMNESISLFHIGGSPKNLPVELTSASDIKTRRKSAFLSNGTLKRAWLGDEHHVWGRLNTLKCRMATVACFNDVLTETIITTLYSKGPMDSQFIFMDEQLSGNIIVNYHALAYNPVDNSCRNLHSYIQSSKFNQYHCGYLNGERLCNLKLEVVINEIGGVAIMLPIIEQLEFMQLCPDTDVDNEDGYRFEDSSFDTSIDKIVSLKCGGDRFITVPDSKSDEQLDDSIMASIVILLRKMTLFDINQHQMERSKCIDIIGLFLQKIETIFLDMNVVIAFHALADQCKQGFSSKIYQVILLDWRIWSRCTIDTRYKHCVFIANLVKHERALFRNQYGIAFFLGVIRLYHSPYIVNGKDENKKLRQELYDMIYTLVHKHATINDYQKMVKFIHECNKDLLIQEMLDLFTKLYESSVQTDQDSLLFYESRLMESLFVLLIRDLSIETKEETIKFLHLIITSQRVQDKHKDHLLLTDISFASIFIYKEFYESPISAHSIQRLLKILRKAAAKDLFGVVQFLSLLTLSPIEQRMSAIVMLKSFFDKSPDAIFAISQQPCWQDIMIHLLVSKKRGDPESNTQSRDVINTEEPPLRTKDINSNIIGFRRSSTWAFDESLNENNGFSKSKFEEILEEDAYSMVNDSPETNIDEAQEVKSIETLFIQTRNIDNSETVFSSDENAVNLGLQYAQRRSMCGSYSGSDDISHISKLNDITLSINEKENTESIYNAEEELIELTLQCLHVVMWSVLSSANNDVSWMTVHQVMESLRSVNERYIMLKSMSYFKQKILVALLNSTIQICRSGDGLTTQNLQNIKELIRLIVDNSCIASTEENYQYEAELFDLAIILLQDCLKVWEEDTPYPELAALGFHYLLTLCCSHDLDIVSSVCARLHHIITSLSRNITYDEIAFIMVHIDRVLKKVINSENYYFIAPILKTLLEHHMDMLQISMFLVNLSIKTPEFYDYFKEYCYQTEWNTFIKSRLYSACEIYESSYLNIVTTGQSLWRAQANEQMSLDRKKRAAMSLTHKAMFESEIINLTINWIKEERRRKEYKVNDLELQNETVLKQWRNVKLFLTSSKGCWQDDEGPAIVHLKQSCRENYLRMRPRFEINYQFDSHIEASKERDNPRRCVREPEPDPLKCLSALEGKIDFSSLGDDQLGDDEWISIQEIEQVEDNNKTITSPKHGSSNKKCLFECRCKLIAFTEVVDGKFELTSSHFIFQGNSTSVESIDSNNSKFMYSINQIREIHLRRYNLRRSAIEIFLTDQTNYFFNFNTKTRDKVYSKILSLRPPNLVYSKQRSPGDLLKNSNLTQKWVNREISNFEYLMQLNTIAGRTYNDLSQYHVFPWIISDYTSPKLDLSNPNTFRDLSKPIGVVNSKNENEVREKYEGFEDPSGVIAKFHYGTHYSSAAGVMHYMVRMEPFTTMHIQLQSGKFDVADRQFHSIPLAWSFIMESPNDNKELIPEFFYQPQFLKNENNFNFGLLQQTKTPIDDVELPAWASSPEDFIYQHRQALESEHVSMNLHNWIDLIFGYKQKGVEAVKALNVFYYATYEGVVDLDQIEDPFERESIESMINNFGQTPCQLLKNAHPRRLTLDEVKSQMIKIDKYLPVMPNIRYLKHTSKSMCSDNEPITFIRVPLGQTRSLMGPDRSLTMITIHSSNIVAKHNWTPSNKGSTSGYYIEIDPIFDSPNNRRKNYLGNLNSLISSNNQLYTVTPDCKFLIAGGNIENRLTIISLSKKLEPNYPLTPHHGSVSCVAMDIDSVIPTTTSIVSLTTIGSSSTIGIPLLGMSGSLDSTCVIWDWSDLPQVSVLQILYGHYDAVTSVSLSVYLDVAISGSRDGTVNLHSITKGQFLHSIIPGGLTSSNLSINFVVLNRIGHVYIQWENSYHMSSSLHGSSSVAKYPKQFFSLYSLHANHISTNDLGHSKVTVVSVVPKSVGSLDTCVLVGNVKGELSILDGYDLTDLNNLRFSDKILDVNVLSTNGQYLSVALSNGQLIISAVCLSSLDN